MKKMILTITLLASQISFAAILNSELSPVQQAAIETAVAKSCGIAGTLTQVSSEQNLVHVDNGITDVYLTTVLKTKIRMDQSIFDDYTVTVKSVLSDSYDHVNQVWGAFSVQSAICTIN